MQTCRQRRLCKLRPLPGAEGLLALGLLGARWQTSWRSPDNDPRVVGLRCVPT